MHAKYSCERESVRALLESVGAEVPPTMQPHFPFVVPKLSYLKFGTVAVLTVTSAKIY